MGKVLVIVGVNDIIGLSNIEFDEICVLRR